MRVCVITATLQIRRLETGVWDNFLRSHSQLEIGPEQSCGYPGVFVFFFFFLSKQCLISSRYIYSQNAVCFCWSSWFRASRSGDGWWLRGELWEISPPPLLTYCILGATMWLFGVLVSSSVKSLSWKRGGCRSPGLNSGIWDFVVVVVVMSLYQSGFSREIAMKSCVCVCVCVCVHIHKEIRNQTFVSLFLKKRF